MKITNVFDAVLEGTVEDFKKYYNGNVNQINPYTKLNLLSTVVLNDKYEESKLEIIKFLVAEGIDISFTDRKYKRNALHTFFFNVLRASNSYTLEVVKILIDNGVDINGLDKFKAIPLKYAITVNKNSTDDMKKIYQYLLKKGADYNLKDEFNKSCIDYAKEYSWRNGFISIVEEYESERH